MSKQGLIDAAITAASIATFLAADADPASADEYESASDHEQLLNLAGEIRQIKYNNLHATLQVTSRDHVWVIILPPSSQLQQPDLLGGVLHVGQHISLLGYRDHRSAYELWAEQVVVGDRTIELR
ncbi:hypothetical protein [Stenomitos frigidus]|uniref:Uncharacterized protein n=1 Tax=Stenomitos frigidus ULC18 TaxID=2107698 RepID=A0A2T1DZD2_9CYAN|nr:hypothetical protein [Stenomitos frigidus]PSB25856.1 hypothetical protein C7B82_21600 [Stenomitos frigidus ULC18]